MKKTVALLLCLCVLLVFPSCGKDEDEIEDTKRTAKTSENPIVTEPTTMTKPVSQWGFNNMEELGYGLVQITGYNLENSKPYVYYDADGRFVTPRIYGFQNGYCSSYKIVSGNSANSYDIAKDEIWGQYSVVDNDSIFVTEDGRQGSSLISNRDTAGTNDFVVFSVQNNGLDPEFYVPFSLINWEEGVCEYTYEEYRVPIGGGLDSGRRKCYFKLYLK